MHPGTALVLLDASDGGAIACTRVARDLLGFSPEDGPPLPPDLVAQLRRPGRAALHLPAGRVAVDIAVEQVWAVSGPAELVVIRPANDDEPGATRLVERLIAALAEHEQGNGDGTALLFVDVEPSQAVVASTRLREALRRSDVVTSLAAGSFAAVCRPVRGEIEAAGLAGLVVDTLGTIFESLTVGVAMPGDPGMTVTELQDDPKQALAAAKVLGRARHAAFSEAADVRSRRQAVIAQALRRALANDELDVHYQPVVDLRDGSVRGVEALARWRPPGGDAVPPDRFIPVAERSGVIHDLGEWVLRQACEFSAASGTSVAVNLSPLQVHPDLIPRVVAALGASGVGPERLRLELTESAVLEQSETTVDVLEELRGLGIQLALDDFGTGYSSLLVLRSLPFDRIKVDRSFVRTVGETAADRELVGAVIALARAVGVAVTAEGVETAEQAELLAELGCDDAQGYLFAAPMPAGACETWLAGRR